MSDLGQEGLYLDDNVDFVLTDESNTPVSTNGLGISTNKQWISFAVPNSGVMVMDLATLKPQRLTNDYSVDSIISPSVYYETSVSSDGSHVLVSGSGLSTIIIRHFDGCGEYISTVQYSDGGKNAPIIGSECQKVYLDSQLRQHDFVLRMPGMAISNAKISGKGDSFYYFNNYYWSNVYAANYNPSTLTYLALGDSYASGEGDLTDDYLPYTNIYGDYRIGVPREMCHISRGSYPLLLAKDMDLQQGLDMHSVACSGAVLRDVFSADKPIYFIDTQYVGQPTQLQKGVGDRLGGLSNQLELQQAARSSFIPGRVQQIEFVHATQPSTVTLMMGGNDLGFGGIMASCAKTIKLTNLDQTCDELTPEGRLANVQKIYSMYPRLRELYKAIKDQYLMPNPRIFVIGYPKFFDGSLYCPDMLALYSQTEQQSIVELIDYANAMIRQAALDEGLKFIEVGDALTDMSMCGKSNGMTSIDDLFVKGIYTELMKYREAADDNIRGYGAIMGTAVNQNPLFITVYLGYRVVDNGMNFAYSPSAAIDGTFQQLAHPNKVGHTAMKQVMAGGLGSDLLYSDACNEIVVCPSGVVLGHAPDPSTFVQGVGLDEAGEKIVLEGDGIVSIASGVDTALRDDSLPVLRKAAKQIVVTLSKNYLEKYTKATLSPRMSLLLHSDPVDLGTFTYNANTDNFEVVFDMPNVMPGYHRLHIAGSTEAGQPLEVVKRIFVLGFEGDIDDDGIDDSRDTCAFGSASNRDIDQDGIDDVCDLYVSYNQRGSTTYTATGSRLSLMDALNQQLDEQFTNEPVVQSGLIGKANLEKPEQVKTATTRSQNQTLWPLDIVVAAALGILIAMYIKRRRT
ncbi:hypothetical protein IPM09_00570 [Candidatus Saccharibacteria bacterium]|nr:MAG: hypothetical protein IPM09_00570 [Candidatus Saccharibacteria bacterium]